MTERDRSSAERVSHPFYAEVRRYPRNPDTGTIAPHPTERARFLPNQAVFFGETLDRHITLSAGDSHTLNELAEQKREELKKMGMLIGMAIANPKGEITVQLPNGEAEKATLGEHKANTAYLVSKDSALFGFIGISIEEVEKEIAYRQELLQRGNNPQT